MRVSITAGDDILVRFGNQIGALGEGEAHKALARAVNRVTDTVHGRVVRAVAKQSSIPAKIVRSTIKKRQVRPGSGAALEGVVYATGSPLPLQVFNPKQFSWGVRAKVWGQMQRYPSHFMYGGRWNSGKLIANGHVFSRTTKERKPIEKTMGPSVPEEMVKGESARVFESTVQVMLPQRVAHELSRLLP